uniref:Olfactory receptor 68 n=1 Tax=Meteorus pulchricornis TaxID=51522 RepID=A0A1S5VFR0_9HYME|nr:olfactory receptor 68 [Meteorus pulchricornis]
MLCIMVNRNDAHELHNILDRHFNEMVNDDTNSSAKLKFSIFRRIWGISIVCVGISLILIAAAPSISIIQQYRRSVNPIFYPLVFPTTYPWSLNRPGPRYKIHLIIELTTVVSQFCVTSIDSLFMMYGFQMGAQFREMSHRIMHVDKTDDVRKIIPECVAQHQAMMRCRDIIQTIFGPILLWVMTTNAISLCSMMFQLSQMKSISIPTILTFGTYITAKTLQAFTYAYTGMILTSEVSLE